MNLPLATRTPRKDLSFLTLSMILERGRDVAKGVVVGSDRFESAQEARNLGYEVNILDRVFKPRELARRRHKSASGNSTSGQTSGSESPSTPARLVKRMAEQGVDELLHLKMLESIVDNDAPSTMVVATGDAAEAEYSPGFLVMIERALKKGWYVELVSFKDNRSGLYTRKGWRERWGEAFRTIELDPFLGFLECTAWDDS
jgi:hypothetical protein